MSSNVVAIALLGLLAAYALYLNALALIALARDDSLTALQTLVHMLFVLCVPLLWALIALHLASHHVPDVVKRLPLGWPLRRILFGKRLPPHREAGIDDVWDEYF
ncbi:MAG: hypothetical protein AAFX56_07285 [Pseudomonadota bacterium]